MPAHGASVGNATNTPPASQRDASSIHQKRPGAEAAFDACGGDFDQACPHALEIVAAEDDT